MAAVLQPHNAFFVAGTETNPKLQPLSKQARTTIQSSDELTKQWNDFGRGIRTLAKKKEKKVVISEKAAAEIITVAECILQFIQTLPEEKKRGLEGVQPSTAQLHEVIEKDVPIEIEDADLKELIFADLLGETGDDDETTADYLAKFTGLEPSDSILEIQRNAAPDLRKWFAANVEPLDSLPHDLIMVNNSIIERCHKEDLMVDGEDFQFPLIEIMKQRLFAKKGTVDFAKWWDDLVKTHRYPQELLYQKLQVPAAKPGPSKSPNVPGSEEPKAVPLPEFTPLTIETLDHSKCVRWRHSGRGYQIIVSNGSNEFNLKSSGDFLAGEVSQWVKDNEHLELNQTLDREQLKTRRLKGISGYAMAWGMWHYKQVEATELGWWPITFIRLGFEEGEDIWISRSNLIKVFNRRKADESLMKRMDQAAKADPKRYQEMMKEIKEGEDDEAPIISGVAAAIRESKDFADFQMWKKENEKSKKRKG